MNPARFEREIARARTRYDRAAHRFERAMADWQAAAVPVALADDTVPPWTQHHREVTDRAAKAWGELLLRHRAWEVLLHDLGCQR